jgi:CRISPR-associated exonuclease Cas4
MTANWPAWALLTLASALGLIVALRRRRAALADRMEWASRPWDLRDAELLYLEKRFDVSEPVRLSTRLDRAYRMPSGLVVLLELKTRSVNRAFPSDVIQLSAQRLALERKTRQVVAQHGYVVTQTPDGAREAHRVQLVSGEAVVALVGRREAILAGRINPRPAASVGVCGTCAYRSICPDRRGR